MEYRCPECRTRRASHALFTRHLRESGHQLCQCGGYHYGHRPGSPYCHRNPLSHLLDAARRDYDDSTLEQIARWLMTNHPEIASKLEIVCEQLKITLKGNDHDATLVQVHD